MGLKERLLQFIEYKSMDKAAFERSVGLSNDAVNKMGENTRKSTIDKISNTYPELNIIWLRTGEGKMLKGSPADTISEVTPIPEDAYMMVEYADLRATAGRLGGGEVHLLPETHKRLVPREYENGKFLVVRVDGDSMDDGTKRSLSDGDEVLITEKTDCRLDELPIKKTLFVITSREGNVLKQIKEVNMEEGYIVCHSFNPRYEDFKIYIEDIYQVFIVCKVTQKQISLV